MMECPWRHLHDSRREGKRDGRYGGKKKSHIKITIEKGAERGKKIYYHSIFYYDTYFVDDCLASPKK